MLHAAEEGKKPPGTNANLPRGKKFLPDPSAGDRLFPEHVSQTWLLVPQAAHASQDLPKPYPVLSYPPSTWSHLPDFRECPNASELMDFGDKNPSWACQDTSGCSKALQPLYILSLTAPEPAPVGNEDDELCHASQEGNTPLLLPLLSG